MLKLHQTREGESRLVCQMDTSHILNTCLLVCREAMKVVARINKENDPKEAYKNQLYGRKTERPLKPEEAAADVKEKVTFLYPYLAELFVRSADIQNDRGLCVKSQELTEYLIVLTPRDNGLMLSGGNEEQEKEIDLGDDDWRDGHPDDFGDF